MEIGGGINGARTSTINWSRFMLIELRTQQVGRWYWATYPVSGGLTGVRLVVTHMDPSNIAVKQVACAVYGVCDYSRVSWWTADGECYEYRWIARKIGFGRVHSNFESFYSLGAAKAWLLETVASRLRQELQPAVRSVSQLSPDYKYEGIGC